MSAWDDSHLWDAYRAAETDGQRNKAAGEIVWFHRKFIYQQANRLAHRTWSADLRDEFDQELLLLAMELVHRFDPDKGNFLTFIKSHMLPSFAWKFIRKVDGVGMTGNTYAARQHIKDIEAEHDRELTDGEVRDLLVARMSVKISVRHVGKLRRFKLAPIAADLVDERLSLEERYVERTELDERARRLRVALRQLGDLPPLEQDLLNRFYQDDPPLFKELGDKYGVSRQAVTARNTVLLGRLRDLLEAA